MRIHTYTYTYTHIHIHTHVHIRTRIRRSGYPVELVHVSHVPVLVEEGPSPAK